MSLPAIAVAGNWPNLGCSRLRCSFSSCKKSSAIRWFVLSPNPGNYTRRTAGFARQMTIPVHPGGLREREAHLPSLDVRRRARKQEIG